VKLYEKPKYRGMSLYIKGPRNLACLKEYRLGHKKRQKHPHSWNDKTSSIRVWWCGAKKKVKKKVVPKRHGVDCALNPCLPAEKTPYWGHWAAVKSGKKLKKNWRKKIAKHEFAKGDTHVREATESERAKTKALAKRALKRAKKAKSKKKRKHKGSKAKVKALRAKSHKKKAYRRSGRRRRRAKSHKKKAYRRSGRRRRRAKSHRKKAYRRSGRRRRRAHPKKKMSYMDTILQTVFHAQTLKLQSRYHSAHAWCLRNQDECQKALHAKVMEQSLKSPQAQHQQHKKQTKETKNKFAMKKSAYIYRTAHKLQKEELQEEERHTRERVVKATEMLRLAQSRQREQAMQAYEAGSQAHSHQAQHHKHKKQAKETKNKFVMKKRFAAITAAANRAAVRVGDGVGTA